MSLRLILYRNLSIIFRTRKIQTEQFLKQVRVFEPCTATELQNGSIYGLETVVNADVIGLQG